MAKRRYFMRHAAAVALGIPLGQMTWAELKPRIKGASDHVRANYDALLAHYLEHGVPREGGGSRPAPEPDTPATPARRSRARRRSTPSTNGRAASGGGQPADASNVIQAAIARQAAATAKAAA